MSEMKANLKPYLLAIKAEKIKPEICGFYNDNETCRLDDKCTRNHVCLYCDKKHPITACGNVKAIQELNNNAN